MSAFTLQDVQEQTYKPRDSWWTVLLVDPFASRLVKLTANRTSITPNQLTVAALLLGLLSAVCFFLGDWYWLLTGALLFHLSFVLDCMDGKVARLKGNGSVFGSWLDYVFDRIRVLFCALALMGGLYVQTDHTVYLWFIMGIVFTDMFRYLNSPQMSKVRTTMRRHMAQTIREADSLEGGRETGAVRELAAKFGVDDGMGDDDSRVTIGGEERVAAPGGPSAGEVTDSTEPGGSTEHDGSPEPGTDIEGIEGVEGRLGAEQPVISPDRAARKIQSTALQQAFHQRFPWYRRMRSALRHNRVRPHLFSGIEFQMGVFIVAPLVGMFSVIGMLVTIAASAVLMLAFELLIIYKLWLSTREFARVTQEINTTLAQIRSESEQTAPV